MGYKSKQKKDKKELEKKKMKKNQELKVKASSSNQEPKEEIVSHATVSNPEEAAANSAMNNNPSEVPLQNDNSEKWQGTERLKTTAHAAEKTGVIAVPKQDLEEAASLLCPACKMRNAADDLADSNDGSKVMSLPAAYKVLEMLRQLELQDSQRNSLPADTVSDDDGPSTSEMSGQEKKSNHQLLHEKVKSLRNQREGKKEEFDWNPVDQNIKRLQAEAEWKKSQIHHPEGYIDCRDDFQVPTVSMFLEKNKIIKVCEGCQERLESSGFQSSSIDWDNNQANDDPSKIPAATSKDASEENLGNIGSSTDGGRKGSKKKKEHEA